MTEAVATEWSLTEAARLLGETQHRLIYLCEKGAIQPDLQDAEGRGSSRRFSRRNLLEFGVALRLRGLGIPASVIGAVLFVLRRFEGSVRAELPGFKLPESLVSPGAPRLNVIIGDDRLLYFTLAGSTGPEKIYGGMPLEALTEATAASAGETRHRRGILKETVIGDLRAKVQVDVSAIARDLGFES